MSVPNSVRDLLIAERDAFITKMSNKVRRRKASPALFRLFDPNTADKRPGVIGYYYMKVSFDTSSWFVLFKHPDRELKMTAWLTVLTSFFGFLMGKMP